MSVQTVVGGIVGAIAGFVVGGPMGAVVGAGLGAGLGAMATPVKVQGAKVGEEDRASVQSGTPIGIILGEGGIKGDLLWQGPRKIVKVKEEQQGKGGGTTVENEEVQRDYGIHFCESNARRGTKIRSVKLVRRNNIIVYDTRPESKLSGADNAKFMANVTFYFGDADQGADPTYETHFGALGAPAYRNQFTMVVRQHLLGKFGNAIPTYEVVTCGGPIDDEEGGGEEPTTFLLVAGQAIVPGAPMLAGAVAGSGTLSFSGIPQSTGGNIPGAVPMFDPGSGAYIVHSMGSANAVISRDNRATFMPFTTDRACNGNFAAGPDGLLINGVVSGYNLLGKSFPIGSPVAPYVFSAEYPPGTLALAHGEECYMCCSAGGYYWMDVGPQGFLIKTDDLTLAVQQLVFKRTGFNPTFVKVAVLGDVVYAATASGTVLASYDGGASFPDVVLSVGAGDKMPLYMKVQGDILVILSRDSTTAWTSVDNFALGRLTGIGGATSVAPPIIAGWGRGEMMDAIGGVFYIVSSGNEDVPEMGDAGVSTADGIVFSDPAPTGLKGVTGIAAGTTIIEVLPSITDDDVEIPDALDHYVDKYHGTYSGRGTAYMTEPVHNCSLSLSSILRTLSQRTPVPVTALDVSRVANIRVRGVSFRVTGPVRTAVDTLAELYQLDVADSGGRISVVPRGGPIDVVVDDGDLLLSTKEVVKGKRGQQSEYPKIATLRYVDPTQDFEESSQRSVIKTKDFRATGEKTYTVSVTMSPNEAATQIARIHAELQDQLEGTIQFDLPMKYLAVIPSTVVNYLGKRYRVTKRRVEPWKIVVDSAVYDRASTYSLTAEGTVTGHVPTPQSDLVGPTMFAPMNMAVAIDAYDRPCLHAVVQGVLPGWRGADIYIKRGTGPYELAVSNMSPGTMGELTQAITAPSTPGIDYAQTLHFKLYANGEAESITIEQLMAEKNAYALLKPDYTVNVGQFIDATEVEPQAYEATGLAWNRLDTSPASFAPGTVIAFLDRVQMIPLRASDLGQTIKVKAVSRGSAIETAPEHTITLATMESQREWQPVNIRATKGEADCSWLVEITGRHRLGTSILPIASQWWVGWRYDFTRDGVTKSHMTRTQSFHYTEALQIADWGSINCAGYGVNVVSVNEYTGGDGAGAPGGGTPSIPVPPGVGPSGGPTSTTPGAFGGFADDADNPIPPATPTGLDVVGAAGTFDGVDPMNGWTDQAGNPLNPEDWSVVDGRLRFYGLGFKRAAHWPSRRLLPPTPLPRQVITHSAKIQTNFGVTAGIGRPEGLMAEYPVETPVTDVETPEIQDPTVAFPNNYVPRYAVPIVYVENLGLARREAFFDDVTMKVDPVVIPTTPVTVPHLNFDTGLADWGMWPPTIPGVWDFGASGGVLHCGPLVEGTADRIFWPLASISAADAAGKYLIITGETWSNDPKMITGPGGPTPTSGVALGVIYLDGAGNILGQDFNAFERGDFTPRMVSMRLRVANIPGTATVQVGVKMRASVGKLAKVRNLAVAITDAVID